MQKDEKMTIKNKEDIQILKTQTWIALMELSKCVAFVAMQEINDRTDYEFKDLNIMCDRLNNLWDYLDTCIDMDLNAHICETQYNLVKGLSNFNVENYKYYYRNGLRYPFIYV